MIPQSDPLPADFADALARRLPQLAPLARSVLFFPTIGSTNDVAAAAAHAGDAEGTIVVADTQTAGRGRRGHRWFSPPGSGLYVSVVLAPARARRAPDRATSLLTLAAGVALAEAVERSTGLHADIKWPNDLLVGGRKLAGILAEAAAAEGGLGVATVVLGYGVNVSPASFPADLRDRVTSLESELGRSVDRASVFGESLAAIAERYAHLLDGRFDAILDAWRQRAPRSRGARVEWDAGGGTRSGITAGIDDNGALLVDTTAGLERIIAGEVRWK